MQQPPRMKERRKNPRYSLQIPILFRWGESLTNTEAGFTRDISLKAFFVNSSAVPPLKTHVRCQILMPTSANYSGSAINIRGRVVRLSTHREKNGFAVMAKLYAYKKPPRTSIQ